MDGETIPPRRLRGIDFAVVGLMTLRNVADAVTDGLDTLQDLVCSHANYLFERNQFQEQAALEIESLTRGED